MWTWMLALALAQSVPSEPSDSTLVYYNARMALREGKSLEAVKLWLLRNTMLDRDGTVSEHDADFHSVTWAALGDLGVCQDGHPADEDAAGLWPLALHNWVVRNMSKKKRRGRPRPFDAFDVGRQQRFISIHEVMSAQELKEVSLFQGACGRQRVALVSAGESVTAKLSDRQVAARLMLYLLEQAKSTLSVEHVRGRSAIDARRFDLYLQLTALSAREARQNARDKARQGRSGGLSRESVSAMNQDAADYTFGPKSEAAQILRRSTSWSVDEWMAVAAERRRFLFLHARTFGADRPDATDALRATALGIIDALAVQGEGEEVALWVGLLTVDEGSPPSDIWAGERGQRLLALDTEDGFAERGVIALHRGVDELATGDLPEALRSMAYALNHGNEGQSPEQVERLSRRWLSYIAAQFEISDELLITLQELVPARDYAVILEDLMWRAAFHADRSSFERGLRNQPSRGAIGRRLAWLEPLAGGNVGGFSTQIRTGLRDAPGETYRFLDQMLTRLELEDGDVRVDQIGMLTQIRDLLEPYAQADGRQGRTANELLQRSQAILEGVAGLGEGTAGDRARALAPGAEVFAGSLRLAPSDALPWPFRAADVPAPSVFMPFELMPEEWVDAKGDTVFGWSIGG